MAVLGSVPDSANCQWANGLYTQVPFQRSDTAVSSTKNDQIIFSSGYIGNYSNHNHESDFHQAVNILYSATMSSIVVPVCKLKEQPLLTNYSEHQAKVPHIINTSEAPRQHLYLVASHAFIRNAINIHIPSEKTNMKACTVTPAQTDALITLLHVIWL